jgi:hypothetical protein
VLNLENSTDLLPKSSTLFQLINPSTFTLFYSNATEPTRIHSQIKDAIGAWHGLMHLHQIAAENGDQKSLKKSLWRVVIYLACQTGRLRCVRGQRVYDSAVDKVLRQVARRPVRML